MKRLILILLSATLLAHAATETNLPPTPATNLVFEPSTNLVWQQQQAAAILGSNWWVLNAAVKETGLYRGLQQRTNMSQAQWTNFLHTVKKDMEHLAKYPPKRPL